MDSVDPSTLLRYFRAAGTDVREVGDEQVPGVDTTTYRARLDLERLLEVGLDELGATEEEREPARREIDRLKREIGASLPATAAVDAEGRLRRMTMEMTVSVGSIRLVYEFFDFGVPVAVAEPPRASVFEAGAGG